MIVGVVVVGFLLIMFVVSLGLRRHGESEVPAGDWTRTSEVFIDPGTGRTMRVWLDPLDGTRHYVEDGPRG